jgi:hypothetical protein
MKETWETSLEVCGGCIANYNNRVRIAKREQQQTMRDREHEILHPEMPRSRTGERHVAQFVAGGTDDGQHRPAPAGLVQELRDRGPIRRFNNARHLNPQKPDKTTGPCHNTGRQTEKLYFTDELLSSNGSDDISPILSPEFAQEYYQLPGMGFERAGSTSKSVAKGKAVEMQQGDHRRSQRAEFFGRPGGPQSKGLAQNEMGRPKSPTTPYYQYFMPNRPSQEINRKPVPVSPVSPLTPIEPPVKYWPTDKGPRRPRGPEVPLRVDTGTTSSRGSHSPVLPPIRPVSSLAAGIEQGLSRNHSASSVIRSPHPNGRRVRPSKPERSATDRAPPPSSSRSARADHDRVNHEVDAGLIAMRLADEQHQRLLQRSGSEPTRRMRNPAANLDGAFDFVEDQWNAAVPSRGPYPVDLRAETQEMEFGKQARAQARAEANRQSRRPSLVQPSRNPSQNRARDGSTASNYVLPSSTYQPGTTKAGRSLTHR